MLGLHALLPQRVASSVALRLLVGVHVVHDRLGLSHKDIHLGNVLLTPCTNQVAETSNTGETLVLDVPTHGVQVMIADFGSSGASAVAGGDEGDALSMEEMRDMVLGDAGVGVQPTPYSRFSTDTGICSLFYLMYGRASPQFMALKARERRWNAAP